MSVMSAKQWHSRYAEKVAKRSLFTGALQSELTKLSKPAESRLSGSNPPTVEADSGTRQNGNARPVKLDGQPIQQPHDANSCEAGRRLERHSASEA